MSFTSRYSEIQRSLKARRREEAQGRKQREEALFSADQVILAIYHQRPAEEIGELLKRQRELMTPSERRVQC